MSDVYWDRFVSKRDELDAAGREHPIMTFPDPQLELLLFAPTPEEQGYEPPTVSARDVMIEYAGGSFGARIYVPEGARADRPMLVWCHGGAWFTGDLEGPEGDATCRELASRADAVVVSVDYRLAVDGVHYPIPLEDVVAAFLWAREHAGQLGASIDRITLGGASAGGNLAAGAALSLRDNAQPLPSSLALAYPTFHARLPEPSDELASKLARMSRAAAFDDEMYVPTVANYIGGEPDDAPVYAFPGTAPNLSGLPPTYIFNAEYDRLRSSAELFAQRLAEAGTLVALETLPDVTHGHFMRPGLPLSQRSYEDVAAWVRDRTAPLTAQIVESRLSAS